MMKRLFNSGSEVLKKRKLSGEILFNDVFESFSQLYKDLRYLVIEILIKSYGFHFYKIVIYREVCKEWNEYIIKNMNNYWLEMYSKFKLLSHLSEFKNLNYLDQYPALVSLIKLFYINIDEFLDEHTWNMMLTRTYFKFITKKVVLAEKSHPEIEDLDIIFTENFNYLLYAKYFLFKRYEFIEIVYEHNIRKPNFNISDIITYHDEGSDYTNEGEEEKDREDENPFNGLILRSSSEIEINIDDQEEGEEEEEGEEGKEEEAYQEEGQEHISLKELLFKILFAYANIIEEMEKDNNNEFKQCGKCFYMMYNGVFV